MFDDRCIPSRTIVTLSPCSTISTSGKAALPWLTKIAGPVSGTGRTAACGPLACPTADAGGQAGGVRFEDLARHAFCNVVNLDGSCLGRSTLTRAMFDSSA